MQQNESASNNNSLVIWSNFFKNFPDLPVVDKPEDFSYLPTQNDYKFMNALDNEQLFNLTIFTNQLPFEETNAEEVFKIVSNYYLRAFAHLLELEDKFSAPPVNSLLENPENEFVQLLKGKINYSNFVNILDLALKHLVISEQDQTSFFALQNEIISLCSLISTPYDIGQLIKSLRKFCVDQDLLDYTAKSNNQQIFTTAQKYDNIITNLVIVRNIVNSRQNGLED